MKILFVVPSLKSGGLERVASLLSNAWVNMDGSTHSSSTSHSNSSTHTNPLSHSSSSIQVKRFRVDDVHATQSAESTKSAQQANAGQTTQAAPQKMDVTLLTLDNIPAFYELDPKIHLIQAPKTVDKGHPLLKSLKKWGWLRNTARKLSPDVILTFGERYNAFVIFALHHLKVPISAGNRTTPLTSIRGFRGFANPIAYRKAKAVFLQTQRSREILAPYYKKTLFEVIPNPVRQSPATIDYSRKVILNVGSFTGKKNQIGLINIFASLAQTFPDWRLMLAGNGPKRAEAEQRAKELGIEKQVDFPGKVQDLDALYEQCSIFAFTSLLEGYPNALAEAMRAGLAAIAYDCITGPAELIRHGQNGMLIDESDAVAYTRELSMLMADPTHRSKLGINAKVDLERLDVNIIAGQYLSLMA